MKPILALSIAFACGTTVAFFAACGDKESITNPGSSGAGTTISTATSTSTSSAGGAGGQGTGGQGAGGNGTGGQGTGGQGTGGQGTGGQGGGDGGAQSLCVKTGGTESTAKCCAAVGDFPNTCAVGACSCAPNSSVDTKVCECGMQSCYDPAKGCVAGLP